MRGSPSASRRKEAAYSSDRDRAPTMTNFFPRSRACERPLPQVCGSPFWNEAAQEKDVIVVLQAKGA